MVYAEYSARSGSFPPSSATSGYSAFPLAANLYDCSFTNSANAHATSCTNDGKLIGPRVTWNTAFVAGPPRKLRLPVQQRQRAFDLRRPDEPNRPRRPHQLPLADQLLQRPRHFQNRHAPAGIVIRPRPLMIQVAAKRNLFLLQFRVRPRNRRRYHLVVARMLPRLHHRMQPNRFPAPQPLAQSPRRLQRHHEPKRLVRRKRLQVSPPN